MRITLLHLLCLFSLCLPAMMDAQKITRKGTAVIYFGSRTPVTVRLDTTLLKQSKEPFQLKEGRYIVKAWAPTKALFVDTITIREGKTTICVKRLQSSEAYKTYKKQLWNFRIKKRGSEWVPLPLTLIYSAYALTKYSSNNKQMNMHLANAKAAKDGYDNGPAVSNLNMYSHTYDVEKGRYESYLADRNKLIKTARIVIPAGVVISAALIYLTRNMKKPVYTEQPLLSFNSISLQREFTNDCSLALTLTINSH